MHIVFFIEHLGGGGAERSVLNLAAGLAEQGCRVTIAVLETVVDYDLPSNISISHLEFSNENDGAVPSREAKVASVIDYLSRLEEEYGALDLIVSNLIRSDELLCQISRSNIYLCIRNHTSVRELKGKFFLKKFAIFKYLRSVYNNQNIIALSQGVAHDLIDVIGVKPKSLKVINNGFDISKIKAHAGEPFAKPFPEYIIHVGSFRGQKRHDRLLRAYAESGIDVPLVLLGKGSVSRERKIRRLVDRLKIRDRVHFAGFHKNSFPWMAGAKMLVLSSDCEGFPRVVVEALVCDTPVVSVDCPSGPSEILTGDLCRGLSETSVAGLAKAMRDIYQNPPTISPNFVEQWSIHKIASEYLELARENSQRSIH